MKKIGLLGGISAASTSQYYTRILNKYYEIYKDYYYPEILINSLNFQYFTDLENENRIDEYINYITAGLHSLEAAGVDFIAMTANSPHSVFPQVEQQAEVPLISITDAVGKAIQAQGLKQVLLTGIKYTMSGQFYQDSLEKYGIKVIVPSPKDQEKINNIIFGELVRDIILPATRDDFIAIIDKYDVQGIILGCTEIPLLLQQKDYSKPLFDSLDLHCEAILNYALERI